MDRVDVVTAIHEFSSKVNVTRDHPVFQSFLTNDPFLVLEKLVGLDREVGYSFTFSPGRFSTPFSSCDRLLDPELFHGGPDFEVTGHDGQVRVTQTSMRYLSLCNVI